MFRRVSGGALSICLLAASSILHAEAPRVGRAVRHGVSKPLSVAQTSPAPDRRRAPAPSAPPAVHQFDGAAANDNLGFFKDVFPPPDANGAAGLDHYVQAINLVFRVFDKSGNTVLGPLPTSSLWTDLGGVCATGTVRSPLVRFDRLASRWIVSQAGFDPSDASVHVCFAVSATADPTDAWYAYDFPIAEGSIATSARLGIWPDAYYVTVNQVDGFADAGFGIYAFDRQEMLDGSPASFLYVTPGVEFPETLWGLPADLDDADGPPSGAPNVTAAVGHPALDGSPSPVLHTWRFDPDFLDPPSTTFEGPFDIPMEDFSPLECGSPTQGCVPQLDSTQLLQATPNRLMYRLAYRNFGDHESLVGTFTIDAGEGRAALRWFELRDPAGNPAIFQQGTFAPDASHRFVGSIAMDQGGNIALGYSKSDATIHPSLAVTGRLAGDPPGAMGSEDVFFEGPNSQPPVVGLWGSYSSMSLDPADECTFWFTSEYIGEPAPFFEYTRIGAFKFPSCTSGPTGALQGTVTEADSGLPIAGARVTAGASETSTDASGRYQFLSLPVGTYDMTVTRFGLIPGSASGVEVTDGGTTTQDFVLGLAPQTLLNGVVRDGSGAGWPLYAKIRVTGPPEFTPAELFTDPVNGYYGITLVTGVTYTLSSEAVVPGYLPDERSLLLETAAIHSPTGQAPQGVVEIIELEIDETACRAPGYGLDAEGLSESFDSGALPPGWGVVNNAGGIGWTIHGGADPCGLFDGNLTGGEGPFALVNSHCEGEVSLDTELVTPGVDLSALSSVQVRFDQDFNGGFPAFGEIADVDISIDGGLSWTNVLRQTVAVVGPNTQSIDVTALAAGQPDVRARFHYHNAFAALWWQVDDVILGRTRCVPLEGGLLVGNVFDDNTGLGLNGATVADDAGDASTTTFGTPEDPAVADGLYVLFTESGSRSLTAELALYGSESKNATVVPNAAQRLDFRLAAGRLASSPSLLSVRVDPGAIETRILDLQNSGARAAGFDIAELDAPPSVPVPPSLRGPWVDPDLAATLLARVPSEALRNGRTARGLPPLAAPRATPLAGGNVVANYATNLSDGWGVAFNTDANDFWISNSVPFGGDDLDYRYLTDGTQTGDTIDDSSWVAEFAADGAYNPRTEMLWRVNVGGDNCIYELDPVAKAPTGGKICPSFPTSQRGLAYDVVSDTFYSGSWTDGVIRHFDPHGTLLDSAYVAVPISGLAFNSSNGRLYALANHDVLLGFDVYVFDTRNAYNLIGAFFITSGGAPVLTPFGGAGMEMDCAGHLWLVDSETQTIFEAETEEGDVCAFDDIPWLTVEPAQGTVGANSTLPVTCTFDATGLSPGLRQAQLIVHTDTPYPFTPVPVDLTVRFFDVTDGGLFDPVIYAAAGAGVMPGCDPAAFLFCPTALVTRADMAGFILRGVHGAEFVPAPYAGAFADVSAGDYNADYIQSFFDEGYTVGCGGGNYCPEAVHTRGQTAVFILKGKHGPSYAPPSCETTHTFDDVPCPPTPESPFGDWIGQLFVEGITAGCGGNNFCPAAGIPNQQMAAFLVRAFGIPHL